PPPPPARAADGPAPVATGPLPAAAGPDATPSAPPLHLRAAPRQHADRRSRPRAVGLDETGRAQHQAPRRIASAGDTEMTRAVAYTAAAAPSRIEKPSAPPRSRGEK